MPTIAIGESGRRGAPRAETLAHGASVGPYRLEGLLGAGGMGRVFKARHRSSGHSVALKSSLPDVPAARTRFSNEAALHMRVHHSAVVKCLGEIRDGAAHWLALELIEGFTLRRLLNRGPLDAVLFLDLATQIAEGLGAIHKAGVIHCDLKAENILLTSSQAPRGGRADATGTGLEAKILDFGIAHDARADEATPAAVFGTYRALSPEKAMGLPLDARSDIFSLGVLFYEMLTGVSPFDAPDKDDILRRICFYSPPPAYELERAIPLGLSDLIDRMLEKHAEDRPDDAEELLAVLESSRRALATG